MACVRHRAFCPTSLLTKKISVLFKAPTAQLKKIKHISQIPLQLEYAIILANDELAKLTEDF